MPFEYNLKLETPWCVLNPYIREFVMFHTDIAFRINYRDASHCISKARDCTLCGVIKR